jgi:putative hydroxymethylpyrimidine transport system ATP-binding protein
LPSHPPPSSPKPASAQSESVVVSGAQLSYAGKLLFDELDVTLQAGACTCLLGPSGVGKTSLLRVIAGLESLEGSGSVESGHGQPLAGRIAYMAQQDLLLPWLDVLCNVVHGARLRGEAPDLDRARDLLERVGLADRANDRPATLSGGMRQRVALARTLMEDRPIVLMDEPYSALDAITRLRLQELGASLLRGRTILLVTHDPLEALRLGHKIFVMAGRPARLVEAAAPPGETPRDAADPVVLERHADLIRQLTAAGARLDQADGQA